MSRKRTVGAFVLLVVMAIVLQLRLLSQSDAAAQAARQPSPNTMALAAGEKSPPATIGQMAWLAGAWAGAGSGGVGGRGEEYWSEPRSGTMVGMFRLDGDKGLQFTELLYIREVEGSLELRLKHFHPDLRGWEEKDVARVFPLVKLAENAAYFSGITFRRTSAGELRVYVAIKGKDGVVNEAEFIFQRQTVR